MASEKDWTLRRYREGDEVGILECLTAAFGSWPAVDIDVPPIDHLRWKLNSLNRNRRFHCVAEAAGAIVAAMLVVARPFKVCEEIILGANYTDLALHPDLQGQGRMKAFWDFAERPVARAFQIVTAAAHNPAVRAYMFELGRRPLANAIDLLEGPVPSRRTTLVGGVPVLTVDRFDRRATALWEAVAPSIDFCVARTQSYLNWRYGDPRAGRYQIRVAQEGQIVSGYAVLTNSRGRGVIADLFALPERPDIVTSLVDDALVRFSASGLPVARCWIARYHPYRDVLLQRGFLFVRTVEGLGFAPYGDTDLAAIFENEGLSVHVMLGDTDIV